ncbi:MAG: outer membrane protein [Phycisphaeraceae bacterium]
MLRTLLSTAFVCALAASAVAQTPPGNHVNSDPLGERAGKMYVSFSAGAAFPEEISVDRWSSVGIDNSIDFETGYTGSAAVGFHADMLRFEAEVGYRSSDIEDVALLGTDVPVGGDVSALSGMINGYFCVGLNERLAAYLGGGGGIARVDADLDGTLSSPIGTVTFNGSDDTVAAYQVLAGLAWELDQSTTLTTGYRLWMTGDPEFDDVDFEGLEVHSVELGLRFNF